VRDKISLGIFFKGHVTADGTWLLWALQKVAPDRARMHLKQNCKLLRADCEMEDIARILDKKNTIDANGMGYWETRCALTKHGCLGHQCQAG
jgi:hypothetical protein